MSNAAKSVERFILLTIEQFTIYYLFSYLVILQFNLLAEDGVRYAVAYKE